MLCNQLLDKLEELFPTEYAEKWDNVGLLLGKYDKNINKIMVAIDPTEDVIKQAVNQQADMLLTHHPLIFQSIKRINAKDFIGKRIIELIQNDINYYAMHTNFDVLFMADAAAERMKLKNTQILQTTYKTDVLQMGIGKTGVLLETESLKECAEHVKTVFQLEHVSVYGNLNKKVLKVAISPGAGGDMIKDAIQKKVDVLITGDIKHHEALDALEQGVAIIDAGHYGLEKIFKPLMYEFMHKKFPQLSVIQAKEMNPIQMV